MSDSTKITPVGITTAALAGSAVGSAIPQTANFIKRKLEGTKIDSFTKKNVSKIKKIKSTCSTRIKNACAELFPKKEIKNAKDAKEIKKIVKHTKGFKGALRKAKIYTKLFTKKFIKPAIKQLKKPNVFMPILGALAGATIYILANKAKQNDNIYY